MDTIDLERKLREDSYFDENVIAENKPLDIHILINKYISEKRLSHAEVIRQLNVERSYGYQLLNGSRNPTRIQLIKLGLIFGLDLNGMQKLLRTGGKEMLYARNIKDAKLIFAIEHGFDLAKTYEFVFGE